MIELLQKDEKKDVTNQEELISVFNDTRNLTITRFNDETVKLRVNTEVYKDLPSIKHSDNNGDVTFVQGGTLEIANKLYDKYKVAALNFADGKKPGGWPEFGCLTQEENICRCSNMYETLITNKCAREYYLVNRDNDNHGLCTDTVIYLPNVTVFKDDRDYSLIGPRQYDIITCPAPSCSFNSDEEALGVYVKRIEQIVLSAIKNNVECLILGAWGCGAFGQDKRLIAKGFIQVLNDYSGYFKEIVFAMKPTPAWNERGYAYNIFLNEFKENYHGNTYDLKK